MKFVRQFCIILLFSLLAEMLHAWIALPIPASIYGLLLMFLALRLGWIAPQAVEQAGNSLIQAMPLMFIPAAVGLVETWPELEKIWLPVLLIVLLTTLVVMGVSGKTAQAVLRWEERRRP